MLLSRCFANKCFNWEKGFIKVGQQNLWINSKQDEIFLHVIWNQASNLWPPQKESIPGQYQHGSEGAYGCQLPGVSLNLPSCIAATGWSLYPSKHGSTMLLWRTCSRLRSGESWHFLGTGLYTEGMQATCLPVTNGLVEMQQASTATCLRSDVSQSCDQSFSKPVEDTVMELRSPEEHLGQITSEQLLVASKSNQTCCGEHSLQG